MRGEAPSSYVVWLHDVDQTYQEFASHLRRLSGMTGGIRSEPFLMTRVDSSTVKSTNQEHNGDYNKVQIRIRCPIGLRRRRLMLDLGLGSGWDKDQRTVRSCGTRVGFDPRTRTDFDRRIHGVFVGWADVSFTIYKGWRCPPSGSPQLVLVWLCLVYFYDDGSKSATRMTVPIPTLPPKA